MERVKAIFDHAIELHPTERDHFLDQVCNADPDLRVRVQVMLDKAQADTVPLQRPEPTPPTTEPVRFIFHVGDVISDRYRVLRPVAKGGMGEVYEVEDSELGTRVALKTINLKSAASPHALERFRREIHIARQVTHPNVCRIYDIGHHQHAEHGDLLYLTMELLEGETLASRVRYKGPLSTEQALPLIRQMVAALSAAHALDIVHRDFKSANVILCNTGSGSGPTVKVTDFGLARSLKALDTSLTVHGEVWGTPDYMAPEQFQGQYSPATDIYALGVVVYEMTTGKLPHRRSSGNAGTQDGKPASGFDALPADWRSVVKRCMSFDPMDRYATADETLLAFEDPRKYRAATEKLLFGLKRPVAWAAIFLVFLASLGSTGLVMRERIKRFFNPPLQPTHIAVLPFRNVGDDPANRPFCDGIAYHLSSKLSQLEKYQQAFWVIPAEDARIARSSDEASRKLNADYVLTGSVQRTSDHVIITINLVDAKKHKQLGSRVLTASVGALDSLQDSVWESSTELVDLQVSAKVKQELKKQDTNQPGAFDYYTQGLGYLDRSHSDSAELDAAINSFTKALVEDPKFALAYAGLGRAYAAKYYFTKDPKWINEAAINGRRAVDLNDSLAPARFSLGWVYQQIGQREKALAEYHRALELDPSEVKAIYHVGEIYEGQGNYVDAESEFKRVIAARPTLAFGYIGLGRLYYNHGKFDAAVTQFQKALQLAPDNPIPYQDLAGAYMQLRRYDEAIETAKAGLKLRQTPDLWSNLGSALMFMHRYPEAIGPMQKAVELSPHNHVYWRNLGDAYHQVPSLKGKSVEAYRKALELARQELKVTPNDAESMVSIGLYDAHLGKKAEASTYVSRATAIAPSDADVLFTSSLVYEIIGHRNQALEAIDRSFKAGFALADIEHEPELDSLHSDPRYQNWLKQVRASSPRT